MSAAPAIEWAVASRPLAGETESGDLHVAATFAGGALVGVIDGLGHGQEAATAARVAAATLCQDPGRPLEALVEACHEALRATRGAVLSLASIDAERGQVTWAGVGNVEGVLCRANGDAGPVRDRIVPRSGVVGYQVPTLRTTTRAILPADVLIFASDGIEHGFDREPPFGQPLQRHADHLLEAYGKSTDDAIVLVVRYLGGGA
jgi:hypothetical protein